MLSNLTAVLYDDRFAGLSALSARRFDFLYYFHALGDAPKNHMLSC
jgi:hypothetical protein